MALTNRVLHRSRRRNWRWRLLHGAFTTAARLGDFVIDRQADKARVEVIRDIPYGRHRIAHRLDVYRPMGAPGPLPVLLYVHGGAFTLCSKDTHRSLALTSAYGAKYLVFNINYRLAPEHLFPAAIADACDAYRWVVEHCEQFGGDPKRIVIGGESAGGNLALGVSIAATYERPERYARRVFANRIAPQGVMPVTPYLQASNPARHRDTGFMAHRVAHVIAQAYLGPRFEATERTLMADPLRVLEECGKPQRRFPAVFSGVGALDSVCWGDVKRLEKACRDLSIPVTAHYYPREIHAFHALPWRRSTRTFWRRAFRFMKKVAEGAPPRKALASAARA